MGEEGQAYIYCGHSNLDVGKSYRSRYKDPHKIYVALIKINLTFLPIKIPFILFFFIFVLIKFLFNINIIFNVVLDDLTLTIVAL